MTAVWADLFHFPLACRLTAVQAGVRRCWTAPPSISQPLPASPSFSQPLPASLVYYPFSNIPGHLSPASQWVKHLNPQRTLQTPRQGNVDDAEGHQVGIRSQGCSEEGKIWDHTCQAQQSLAAQLSPMWCHREGELDDPQS